MPNKRCHPRRSGGFTLIEVATSLTIMSVLMLGLSSAIVIASHSIPDPTSMGVRDQQIIDVLNQLRNDLRDCNTIKVNSSAASTELTLDLNDTGGIGSPAKVVYLYTTASADLTRKVDAAATSVVLTGVVGATAEVNKGDTKAIAVHMVFKVSGSIQYLYEVHAVLPQEPVFQ